MKQGMNPICLRQLNKECQEGNNYLFDIGKNMDKLVNREHIFYTDQKTVRERTLSNQIDTEYEEEQRIICEHGEEQLKKSEEEEAFIMADIETMGNYDEDVNISMNTSISDTLNVSNNNCIVKEMPHFLIKKLLLHTAGIGASRQRTSEITWCFINRKLANMRVVEPSL